MVKRSLCSGVGEEAHTSPTVCVAKCHYTEWQPEHDSSRSLLRNRMDPTQEPPDDLAIVAGPRFCHQVLSTSILDNGWCEVLGES